MAVERLISAYFGEGYVMEWYEMYDSPYTFVALTTNTNTDAQNFEKFVEAVKAAKNARSHLAGVFYFWQQGPDPGIEYRLDPSLHRYNFVKCGTRPRIATVGFVVKPSIETDPEETLHLYGFTKAGELTCGTYPRPGTLGAIVKSGITAEAETQAIRYNFAAKPEPTQTPPHWGAYSGRKLRWSRQTRLWLMNCLKPPGQTCGTYPRPGTLGKVLQHTVGVNLAAAFSLYQLIKAGTQKCGTMPGGGVKGRSRHKQSSYSAASLQRGVWLREMRDAVLR